MLGGYLTSPCSSEAFEPAAETALFDDGHRNAVALVAQLM
jgi:hypothetical protein